MLHVIGLSGSARIVPMGDERWAMSDALWTIGDEGRHGAGMLLLLLQALCYYYYCERGSAVRC